MFSLQKLFTLALIIAVIILWYKTCNPPKPVLQTLQPVTSIKDQKAVIVHDSIVSKRLNDSVVKEINKYMRIAMDAENTRDEIAMQNLKLQDQMDAAVTNTEIPDTCKAIVAQISTLNNKLKQSAIESQRACNNALNAKNSIIGNKDVLLQQSAKDIFNLRRNLDTAFAQQSKLQSNIKKLKPRSSIGVGVMTEAAYAAPYKFDAGAFLYFRNKMGNQISVGVFQSQRIQLSYSKNLLRF